MDKRCQGRGIQTPIAQINHKRAATVRLDIRRRVPKPSDVVLGGSHFMVRTLSEGLDTE